MLAPLLGVLASWTHHDVTSNRLSLTYSWENPSTKLRTTVDGRWAYSALRNGSRQPVYQFLTKRAEVILFADHAAEFTLQDYVRAFENSSAANIRLVGGGRLVAVDGRQGWQDSGSMIDHPTHRFSIQVVQVGDVFWRIVTIQTKPYRDTTSLAKRLRAALWNTVTRGSASNIPHRGDSERNMRTMT